MAINHARLDSLGSSSEELLLSVERKDYDGVTVLKSSEPEGHANFVSGFINLLKTAVGAGMLSLPIAIASLGVIPGILLLTAAALASAFGLHLLSVCAEKAGRTSSVFTISQLTYPKVAVLFDFAIVIKCFGVACSYLVVIRNLMPSVAIALGAEPGTLVAHPILWLTVFHVAASPLSFLKKVDKLKYTSFVGLLGVAYLVALSISEFVRTPAESRPEIEWFTSISPSQLQYVGVFIFAFTCHQNIFPIKNEAKNNSVRKMDILTALCMGTCLAIYSVFGLLCYFMYGKKALNNVLSNFPNNEPEFIIARLLFVFLMACSYPLQTHPCRISFEKVAKFTYAAIKGVFRPKPILVEEIIPVPSERNERTEFILDKSITLGLLLSSYTVAYFFDNLSYLTSLVGSTASVLICYILPFIFYYKITEKEGWTATKIGAAAMAAFGVLAIPFFLVTFFL